MTEQLECWRNDKVRLIKLQQDHVGPLLPVRGMSGKPSFPAAGRSTLPVLGGLTDKGDDS